MRFGGVNGFERSSSEVRRASAGALRLAMEKTHTKPTPMRDVLKNSRLRARGEFRSSHNEGLRKLHRDRKLNAGETKRRAKLVERFSRG